MPLFDAAESGWTAATGMGESRNGVLKEKARGFVRVWGGVSLLFF